MMSNQGELGRKKEDDGNGREKEEGKSQHRNSLPLAIVGQGRVNEGMRPGAKGDRRKETPSLVLPPRVLLTLRPRGVMGEDQALVF